MPFAATYATAAARWPQGTASSDVPTTWGRTHLLTAGPPGAPTVLLLHGDGATATAWAGVAGALHERFRVVAPDQPGNPGRSGSSRPFRSTADLVSWVDELAGTLAQGGSTWPATPPAPISRWSSPWRTVTGWPR